MRPALVCAPVALLFLASVLPSNAQKAGGERVVSVRAGAPLAVDCELRVEQRAEWRLDGAAPPPDMRAVEIPALPGAHGSHGSHAAVLTARLQAPHARPHHAGLYTCAAGATPVRVVLRPHAAADAADHDTEPALAAAAAEAGSAASEAEAAEAVTRGGVLYYDVRGPLALDCSALAGAAADPAAIVWRANGTRVEELPALQEHVELSKARDRLSVRGRSREDDFGNYTCTVGPGQELRWEVRGRPHAKLPANTNVVEGQKLKLTCKLTGKPYPGVRWVYSNTTDAVTNATLEAVAALGERVTLSPSEQGVPGAQLVLDPAQRSDAGWYTCVPEGGVGAVATTVLRVKDMYAALWPFLGICAEVFVLCAVILVYEKRRTKPELDDSDTDNHDPKKS